MSSKDSFIAALRIKFSQIAVVMETSLALQELYHDRGFDGNHGGANPITDADVASYGLKADQVYSATVLLNALDAFFQANSGANRAIVNIVRDDK
jgi:hypothetical protein